MLWNTQAKRGFFCFFNQFATVLPWTSRKWCSISLPQRSAQSLGEHAQFLLGLTHVASSCFSACGWLAQVWGEKEWTLFPPDHALFSAVPTKEFKTSYEGQTHNGFLLSSSRARLTQNSFTGTALYDNAKICTQRSGDILLVPHNWGQLFEFCVCLAFFHLFCNAV